jgi:uncharacterized protein involved in outer membrane biogenesis
VLKKLLIAIPILLLLFVASAIVAYKYVGNEFIEAQTQYQLERLLNRKVTINGDFSFTRTARPTLTTSNIRIASADWDPDNYLIEADHVAIQINAIPLIFGTISIDSIIFNKTNFNIVINEQGESNLDFGDNHSFNSGMNFYTPEINKIEMTDLVIKYQNHQRNTNHTVGSNKLSIAPVDDKVETIDVVGRFDDQEIEIAGEMCRLPILFGGGDCTLSLQIDSPPLKSNIAGDISIQGKGYIDMMIEATGKNINELKLPFKTYLPDTETAQASFLLSGDLDSIRLSRLKSSFTFDASKASASGSIESVNTFSGMQIKVYAEGTDGKWLDQYQDYFPGELIDHYTLSAKVADDKTDWKFSDIEASAKIDETTLFGKGKIIISQSPISLSLNINGRGKYPEWIDRLQDHINAKYIDDVRVDFDLTGKNNAWSIENLKGTALTKDHTFTANGNLEFSADKTAKVELEISSSGRNFYSLSRVINYNLPESKKFSISSRLKYQKPTLALTNTSVIIDDTSVTGNAEIDILPRPNIRAQLNSKSLNIDHIIALSKDLREMPPTEKKTGEQPLFSDEPLDLEWLHKADSNVDLKVERIIFKQAEFENLQTKFIESKGIGELAIDSIHYSGSNLTASFKVDINTHTHAYDIHTENFNIGKLFKEINTTDLLTGKVDFNLNIDATGTTPKQLAENSHGGFTAFIVDGSVDNTSIDILATNLVNELLPGKKPEPRIEIECFFSQFEGKNGVLKSEATLLNTKNIVMIASGNINLGKDKYDLRLIPKPKNTSFFTLDSDVLVTGPLNDPEFKVSKGSLLKKVLQGASVLALGPAGLALPFTTMGSGKYTKCFEEVAEGTAKAVKAQQESQIKDDEPAKPRVESLNP